MEQKYLYSTVQYCTRFILDVVPGHFKGETQVSLIKWDHSDRCNA